MSQAHPRGTVLYFADNKGLNFFVKNEQGEGFDFHYSIFQNGWEIQQEKVHLETGEEKLIQVRTDNIFDASLVTISLKTSTSDLEISRYLYKRKE